MAKSALTSGSPDSRFRREIEAALAAGSMREDLVLHLTYRDANILTRDPKIPVADISFAGGVMRFLGVRVEKGEVQVSALARGAPEAGAAEA